MKTIRKILKYIKGSLRKGLWFKSNGHLRIERYCDANWIDCVNDCRFMIRYCICVGDNLVVWRSKKQDMVVKSLAETECRAMILSLCEMM
jgi:hypothetical protein